MKLYTSFYSTLQQWYCDYNHSSILSERLKVCWSKNLNRSTIQRTAIIIKNCVQPDRSASFTTSGMISSINCIQDHIKSIPGYITANLCKVLEDRKPVPELGESFTSLAGIILEFAMSLEVPAWSVHSKWAQLLLIMVFRPSFEIFGSGMWRASEPACLPHRSTLKRFEDKLEVRTIWHDLQDGPIKVSRSIAAVVVTTKNLADIHVGSARGRADQIKLTHPATARLLRGKISYRVTLTLVSWVLILRCSRIMARRTLREDQVIGRRSVPIESSFDVVS